MRWGLSCWEGGRLKAKDERPLVRKYLLGKLCPVLQKARNQISNCKAKKFFGANTCKNS